MIFSSGAWNVRGFRGGHRTGRQEWVKHFCCAARGGALVNGGSDFASAGNERVTGGALLSLSVGNAPELLRSVHPGMMAPFCIGRPQRLHAIDATMG